ncbi:MAG: hypothetical protein AAB787_01945 [Patescibacteria group bacterium]
MNPLYLSIAAFAISSFLFGFTSGRNKYADIFIVCVFAVSAWWFFQQAYTVIPEEEKIELIPAAVMGVCALFSLGLLLKYVTRKRSGAKKLRQV